MLHDEIARLAEQLRTSPALVLSGAGLSTDSGLPDYRSPEALANPREPMRYQEFVRNEAARRRYWARSHASWRRTRTIRPNAGHRAVAALEARGAVTGVLTQNVDGLHQQAGSHNVVELHGTISRVRCLNCGTLEPMDSFQRRLAFLNPTFDAADAPLNPDGDAELAPQLEHGFQMAACTVCGGMLKTDVVFFGENVPAAVMKEAWAMLDAASSLLVVGSSLTVRSGFRFVVEAHDRGLPVAIVNRGPTRGDDLAQLRINASLSEALPHLLDRVASNAQ